MLQKLQSEDSTGNDAINYISTVIELMKFFESEEVTNSLEWVLERHIVTNLQRRGLISKEDYLKRISDANKLLGR